jgi:DDE superfamily endonuclease
VPRTVPPAAGWSPHGHRIKAELDDSRGPEKTWVYGALRVRDGKELTRCAASRNSKGYIALLTDIEADNPSGDLFLVSDNLSSHNSLETRTWLERHPRIHHVFIPTGACWLNLQEGWWRLFRRDALAGQSFANPKEIEQATASLPSSSTDEPNPGSGVGLPKITVITADSFVIAFNERSIKYSNKTGQPLALVWAILCVVYASGGFNERSTKLAYRGSSPVRLDHLSRINKLHQVE